MVDQDKPVKVSTEEARAGATPHMTRYILGISMVLVIAIFAYIVMR